MWAFIYSQRLVNLRLKLPKRSLKSGNKLHIKNYSLLITVIYAHDVIRQDKIITCYFCGFVDK